MVIGLILSVSVCVLLYCVIVLSTANRALEQDTVRRRINQLSQQTRRTYNLSDEELSKPLSDRLFKPMLRGLGQFFARFLPARKGKRSNDARLKKLLLQAGWSISAEDYMVIQFVLMVGCGLIALLLGIMLRADAIRLPLYPVMGGFGAYTVLRFVLTSRGTARRTAIEQQLPDMLDLLSVSVEAGLGFEQALRHITENMEGPLVDEVAVTYREMAMGRPRRDALTLLGERCNVPDVQSFTSALVQASQLGISIKNVLRAQSEAIRRSRKSKVEEKAAKVSTKILLPMLLFIFPVLFIVLMGPSVLNIMEVL